MKTIFSWPLPWTMTGCCLLILGFRRQTQPLRKATFELNTSKHLNSYYSRQASSVTKQEEPDARKSALLEKLFVNDVDSHETGHELRKARKVASSKVNGAKKKEKASRNVKEKSVRFVLGDGTEVLTAQSIMNQIKSAAPYLFPELNVGRLVIEEEEWEAMTGGPSFSDQDDAYDARSTPDSAALRLNRGILLGGDGANGWQNILQEAAPLLPSSENPSETQRINYFALCMASHFSTVATFVPTDIDNKIRGYCWFDPSDFVLKAQFNLVKQALGWNVNAVSKRTLFINAVDSARAVSGHDGEWLGVLAGAWGAFLRKGGAEYKELADEAESLLLTELEREATMFRYLRSLKSSTQVDTALVKLAAIMTHNVGDVDQGLSYWKNASTTSDESSAHIEQCHTRYSRLAHERPERFGGEFARAKLIYHELVSAEGHRNYPLREARALRSTPDLMLPLSPWLENWGRLVATHPALSLEDRVQVARQLLRACDPESRIYIPNQVGYFRALYGFASVTNLDSISKELDKSSRDLLKSHELRLHLGMSDETFATKIGRRCRDLLSKS